MPIILLGIVTIAMLVATLYPSGHFSGFRLLAYDKFGHFLMFLVWTFLYGVVRAVRTQSAPKLVSVFLWGLFYGVLIEVLQFILPTNRSPELLDFVADALGSLVAVIALKPIFRSWFNDSE